MEKGLLSVVSTKGRIQLDLPFLPHSGDKLVSYGNVISNGRNVHSRGN